MADGVDIVLEHDLADTSFRNIVNSLPELVDEDKIKLVEAFKSLSWYYKNNLLGQLEKTEKINKNSHSEKVQFIKDFLHEELGNFIEITTQPQHQYQWPTDEQAYISTSPQSPKVLPKIIHNNLKAKDISSLLELERLIGLDQVKLEIRKLTAFTEMTKLRSKYNLKSNKQSLHMIFKGNPGTGKTTVARLLGKILHEIGVLSIGHVIELDRSNLTSKYQGEIEQRINDYAEQAKGGILFIDEIYSLYQKGDHGDQGKQGIEVLLKVIEDKRDDFVCIGAGYIDEVNEFLGSNPGLLSRFSLHIHFDDYTSEQLLEIALQMFEERDYTMNDSFKEKLSQYVLKEKERENFANARVIRNIVESAIREQSLRLFNSNEEITEKDLMTILGEDFNYEAVSLKQ